MSGPEFQKVEAPLIAQLVRNAAVARLQTGKTQRSDGEHDRRGGLIWHTQGSGKSLSMVFLVRKLRSIPALRKFKVVLVTEPHRLAKAAQQDKVEFGQAVLNS